MKITARDFARGIGLKLTHKKHIKQAKTDGMCFQCKQIINKGDYYFSEMYNKPLSVPIITPNFILTSVPQEIFRYHIECSKVNFGYMYKKQPVVLKAEDQL